jgi:Zn finger protein HypA/HybF involved in hydrogenase expression
VHELSLAEDLVRRCRELAAGRKVAQIWLRCSAGIDTEELAEAFRAVTLGSGMQASTPQATTSTAQATSRGAENLSSARLVFELAPSTLACSCGFSGEPIEDGFIGHMAVCPGCGKVEEVDPGLELVGIAYG